MTFQCRTAADWARVVLFGSTCLLSAFLLFQVQPLISKAILPWFGGGPAVWTMAMLFFQVLLFAGYLYSYSAVRFLPPRALVGVHTILLLAALATLPINPDESWLPTDNTRPEQRVLLVLLASVGLPYFTLASTAPLIQVWFSRAVPSGSPYRLYSLSNAGSLLALLSYPFIVEPLLGLRTQGLLWSSAFALFAVACAVCGAIALRLGGAVAPGGSPAVGNGESHPPRALWLLLPFCASVLLLATTNYLCQEVASLPFLWLMPLAVYLVTFILCFDSDRWYRRRWYVGGLVLTTLAAGWMWGHPKPAPLGVYVGVSVALLFACGMVCHGELARLRPPVSGLTAFYLCVAGGGALGGLFVNLIAPLLFARFLELPLAVILCWLLVLTATFRDPRSTLYRGATYWTRVVLLFICANLGYWLLARYSQSKGVLLFESRNFYGTLAVLDTNPQSREHRARQLRHGRITHGVQYTNGERHGRPLHYFGPESGVGRVLGSDGERARRVGVIGLGIGTLAAYGRPNDVFRFYEINPLVISAAQEWFTYLRDSAATIEIVEGDARLSLEQELASQGPQGFDVLVLDAFSGDAIPVHLLTQEAFECYDRHLKPDGALVIHVSNLYFDLTPAVMAAATALEYDIRIVTTTTTADEERLGSIWVVASKEAGVLDRFGAPEDPEGPSKATVVAPWSDDFSNLWSSLR